MLRHLNDFNLTGIHIAYLEHPIGFQLQRWALKVMSFVILANNLFVLTQSPHLRKLLEGTLSVQVLTSPTTTPYRCDLSPETIQVALDAALRPAGANYLSAEWAEDRRSFQRLLKGLEDSQVDRPKPTVHAELAMIMAMVKGKIEHVEPYIGVSKLSCLMCSHYIRTFNQVTKQRITTNRSHGKAYPGWSWPSLPNLDGMLRPAFLEHIRQQLLSDFKEHAKMRRLSDGSVGSGGPEVRLHVTKAQLDKWLMEC